MTFKFYINIGDWSEDGHSQSDQFLMESNYSVSELQEAYKKSCEKTGIKIHELCSEYGKNEVEPEIVHKLVKVFGCPLNLCFGEDELDEENDEPFYITSPEQMLELIIWFVKLSMPEDCTVQRTDEGIPHFNGFWGDLNESFGYGLYFY